MSDKIPPQKKGELLEIRQDLLSDRKEKRKAALKKVISFMTVGKDVSSLFADVIGCLQNEKLEIKKLVYLYLMNYAKLRPQMALLAVNTFVKDCDDPNPLIRALAIRTMGCIRLENIAEYLCSPLRKALVDEDPYVRKTAVVCVAKFYKINPEMAEQQGFIVSLKKLLSDANPMVIANTVASLSEIALSHETPSDVLELNSINISKLLTCLGECTEWGQIFILDSISEYIPQSPNEAKNISDRITSRLSHSNAAVVLSTCKVLLVMGSYVEEKDVYLLHILKKMAPPLVTLLSAVPEIQYVALRNINIITQKFPSFLKNDVKAFFVKYNDPIYVKLEKLEILNRLVSVDNADIVLSELKEYSSEVDVEFVRKAIRSIGRCALKVDVAADHCVKILADLMQTQINYVVQESVIVIKDIIRRYPNRYESVIEKVSASAGSIDEPEARASLIWILGEFSDNINNIGEVLRAFFDGFLDEATIVQLQLLTAVVKLFLRSPKEHKDLVQEILTIVTQKCGNPDLRDRGHIYWRLLSNDSTSARDIVLAEKPLISEQTTNLDETLLDELISQLATLSSIYHKIPHTFIQSHVGGFINPFSTVKQSSNTATNRPGVSLAGNSKNNVSADVLGSGNNPGQTGMDDLLLDLNDTSNNETQYNASFNSSTMNTISQNDMNEISDIMGHLSMGISKSGIDSLAYTNINDSFNTFQNTNISHDSSILAYSPSKTQYLNVNAGKGLEIWGTFSVRSGILFMNLTLKNCSMGILSDFSLAINKNTFGIGLSPGAVFPQILSQQQSADVTIPLNYQGSIQTNTPINLLQVAIKNNIDIFHFPCFIPLHFCLVSHPVANLNQQSFAQSWEYFPQCPQSSTTCVCKVTGQQLLAYLQANFIFTAYQNISASIESILAFCALHNGNGVLLQISVNPMTKQCEVICKSNNPQIVPGILSIVTEILAN